MLFALIYHRVFTGSSVPVPFITDFSNICFTALVQFRLLGLSYSVCLILVLGLCCYDVTLVANIEHRGFTDTAVLPVPRFLLRSLAVADNAFLMVWFINFSLWDLVVYLGLEEQMSAGARVAWMYARLVGLFSSCRRPHRVVMVVVVVVVMVLVLLLLLLVVVVV